MHIGIIGHLDTLGEFPALMAPAQRACKVAAGMLAFFDAVILEHHAGEERVLFPAVQQSALRGPECSHVQTMVERLTVEDRQIEAWWSRPEPHQRQIAKGHDTALDTVAVK